MGSGRQRILPSNNSDAPRREYFRGGHSRAFLQGIPVLVLIILATGVMVLMALSGCNSKGAERQKQPDQNQSNQPQNSPDAYSPPAPRSDVGERLGRLDAWMRDAMGDSLRTLQTEYKRILDSIDAANREPVQTGGPATHNRLTDSTLMGADSTSPLRERDSTMATAQEDPLHVADSLAHLDSLSRQSPLTERDSLDRYDSLAQPTSFAHSDSVAYPDSLAHRDSLMSPASSPLAVGDNPPVHGGDSSHPSAPPASQGIQVFENFPTDSASDSRYDDPSKVFKGLRKSELHSSPSYSRSIPRTHPPAPKRRTTEQFASRRSTPRRSAPTPRYAAATRTPGSAKLSAKAAGRKLVNGMAATRAGNYNEAVQQLAPAVKSRSASAAPRMDYALALEKSGQLSRAADEYLKLSRTGGETGHKAYVSYCRLLAKLGQRDRAKRLVLQFIERYPDSTQVVTARRLLQTL